ncbi:hypothetical protein [Rhodococcus opacus]|nr:hypothetical protein [Rhodococcus opacus]
MVEHLGHGGVVVGGDRKCGGGPALGHRDRACVAVCRFAAFQVPVAEP